MRLALVVCLGLAALPAYPAEPDDRKAINQTIEALNKRLSGSSEGSIIKFFAPGASAAIDFLLRQQTRQSQSPLSEVSPIYLNINAVRIDSDGIATVYVELTQYGSLLLARRESLVFTMERAAPNWLITSIKSPPPTTPQ